MNKAICLTLDNNYKFTQKTLVGLSSAEGSKNWSLITRIDPQCPGILKLIRGFDGCFNKIDVSINPIKYGYTINFLKNLGEVIQNPEAQVLILNNRIKVSKDALYLAEWYFEHHEDDETNFALSLCGGIKENSPHILFRMKNLIPYCWATTSGVLKGFLETIETMEVNLNDLLSSYIEKNSLTNLYPVSSRALVFGEEYTEDSTFDCNSSFYGEFES